MQDLRDLGNKMDEKIDVSAMIAKLRGPFNLLGIG